MITKNKILEILNDWNFWQKSLETGINRDQYLEKIDQYFKTELIISVIGLRRSGKSTLLLQYAQKLIQEKKFLPKDILYINFEDGRFLGEYSLDLLNEIYDTYLEQLKPNNKPLIILDEIQNITGWEKFVNSLYERHKARIFVSGSNAQLLHSELSAVLTGRQLVLNVYPLTFKEFLLFNNLTITDQLSLTINKVKIKQLFDQYCQYGGLPKVVLLPDETNKETVLRNFFDDILHRDLIAHFKIRQTEKLNVLTKFYLTNIANLISYNSIAKFLKIPTSTIERFSDNLASAFLFYFVNKFSFSLKEQTVHKRKIYVSDVGLRNAVSFQVNADRGRLLENLVYLQLRQTQEEIYYYKTKNNLEVDFLVREKQKNKILIQVCVTLKNYTTREREIKALLLGMTELTLTTGLIITEDEEETITIDNKTIQVIPICSWLLTKI